MGSIIHAIVTAADRDDVALLTDLLQSISGRVGDGAAIRVRDAG